MVSLISTAEKYLKTDVRYILKGSFWLFTGQGIHVIFGLIISVVFANMLSKSDFGTYQFIISIATVIGTLTLAMHVPVKRESATGRLGALRYGFWTQLKWSVGIVILSLSFSLYYFVNDNELLGKAFIAIGTLVPLFGSFSLYKQFLLGKQKFKEVALLGLFMKPILTAALLFTLFISKDPLILAVVYLSTNTAVMAFLYFKTVKKYKLPYLKSIEMLHYSKHLGFLSIISVAGKHAEKLILFYFMGATQVAVYAIATLPTSHLLYLYRIFGELVFPKFTKHKFSLIQKSIHRKIAAVLILSIFIVLLFVLSAPLIYKLLFPLYPEAVLLAQVASLSLLTKFGNLFSQAFQAHQLTHEQYTTKVLPFVVKIFLLVALIPNYGIWGAIFATLIANTFWSLLSFYIFLGKKQEL